LGPSAARTILTLSVMTRSPRPTSAPEAVGDGVEDHQEEGPRQDEGGQRGHPQGLHAQAHAGDHQRSPVPSRTESQPLSGLAAT
jgi:hypothetical protein